MRDILTFLAGFLVLILVAALAVPPLVDWRDYRPAVEAALTRAAGVPVATDGAIDLRLLPTPRMRVERLRLGTDAPDAPSLDAQYLRAEIALTPLLGGEIRVLSSRVGRIELKLPTGAGGNWRIPRTMISAESLARRFAFEDLFVAQLLATTVDPSTGRTDQLYAESVHVTAQSLAGPWRADGTVAGVPFSLVTGEIATGGVTNLKLLAGAESGTRLNLDARLGFAPGVEDSLIPSLAGSARLSASPARAGGSVPFAAAAQFELSGKSAELTGLTVEAGEGPAAIRLAGSGRLLGDDEPVLSLSLEGRRVDLGAVLGGSAGDAVHRLQPLLPPPWLPVDLALKVDSVSWAGEDVSGLTSRLRIARGRLSVLEAEATLPGQSRVALSGEVGLEPGASAAGRVGIESRNGERLASFFAALGAPQVSGALEGRAVTASADVVLGHPVTSLRNLRLQLGDGVVTGAVRYTAPDGSTRARLDAQLAIQNLDLPAIPPVAWAFDATRSVDVGMILDARNVGYGSAERGGRISARIATEGSALAIERLEIADLAGANANLSGRIGGDGTGRIAGRLTARRAAPLIDLIGPFWVGNAVALIPAFVREDTVDLNVSAERAASSGGSLALATRITGSTGSGSLDASLVSAEARLRSLDVTLATERTASWMGAVQAGPALRPSRIVLSGAREPAGRIALTATGDVAGVRLATVRPFRLGEVDDQVGDGEVDLASDDVTPLASAWGQSVAGPLPLAVKATFARVTGVPHLTLSGRLGDVPLTADLLGQSLRSLGGEVKVGRIALPWLASALALREGSPPPPGSTWSGVRFGPEAAPPIGGDIEVKADVLELGRGLRGEGARFSLATTDDGFAIRDLEASLAGGRIAGSFTVTRQGGQAAILGSGSVNAVPLSTFIGPPFSGRLTGDLRFGGSGESAAAIVANLGGSGQLSVDDLRVSGADAAGVERAASRALRSDDPLAPARLAAFAGEELNRAEFRADRVTGPATLVGGVLRAAPVIARSPSGSWQGSVSADLRTLALDIRGALQPAELPRNWTGGAPYLGLGWSGPVARPLRQIDAGPLGNGLAAVVLARELERIEIFELDAAERARRNSRLEMDRTRRAAEEAARLAKLREEAERARAEAERARLEAERARSAVEAPLPPPARP